MRRFLIGWTTALTALGLSTAALALALWLVRVPIAKFMITAALAERGVEADFDITQLNLSSMVVSRVRVGAEAAPDIAVERIEARWRWAGLLPRLLGIRIESPHVRVRLTPEGRVSFGALDRMRTAPGASRPTLPEIELEIVDGRGVLVAPFGNLAAMFESAGVLGADFTGVARIPVASYPGDSYALENGAAELTAVSRDNGIAFSLTADAGQLVWEGARTRDAHVRMVARAPLDLATYDIEAAWRVGALHAYDVSADFVTGALGAEARARETSLNPETWGAQLRFNASALTLLSNRFEHLRVDANAQGSDETGAIDWILAAKRFNGLSMISEQPSASGALALRFADGDMRGEAQLALSQSRLDANAQQRIRATFPELGGLPLAPTFANAKRALDAAADRFDLSLPLAVTRSAGNLRIAVAASAEARSSTGARLRLSPLRTDAPALVLQWPGPALHGAVALELAGGGVPDAALLLDTTTWSPHAPFEADGTLSIDNWRAARASIAADELEIGIAIQPGGAGRIDLAGTAHITGPLGEGEVRDLAPDLNIAITWRPGWRVTPNRGCMPTRLGGLDAAGLSFASGSFSLCALDGALMAADAQRNLSGGFVLRELALNGQVEGQGARPARLSSPSVAGRFSGRVGDVALAIDADRPRLSVVMSEGRTLAVVLQRLTANAHIAESWRVAGGFESGALTDPALPGAVTAIQGSWSAQPEDGAAVVRVVSGAALLTANQPNSDRERTLFNPLRLADVNAVLRRGRVDASGDIELASEDRDLADFTAWHEMNGGIGGARIEAPSLTFSESLQPYEITERARGAIENVRGPASAVADVAWSGGNIDASGRVRLEGVSFSTTTLPIVQDVRGTVLFDDLFALTTPPSQEVTVGLLSPGIAVRNGRVRFQLQPEQRVSIEHAVFEFAGGELAMQPIAVTLGQSETQIVLTLRDVDAASLIAALNIPDLAATGRLEGSFPLRLTARTALVENGVLRALPGGGLISYTGNAGRNATGMTRVAFDALRGFRYDELALTLNGDISGEVLTEIAFSGENAGRPVNLGPIAPGLGNVSVRGVPFDFNVRITAPFRSLAQTAASIADPGRILNRANDDAEVDIELQSNAPQ